MCTNVRDTSFNSGKPHSCLKKLFDNNNNNKKSNARLFTANNYYLNMVILAIYLNWTYFSKTSI